MLLCCIIPSSSGKANAVLKEVAAGGVFIFLCVIRRHFRWVRADSGGNVFFAKYGGPSGGSQQSGANVFS